MSPPVASFVRSSSAAVSSSSVSPSRSRALPQIELVGEGSGRAVGRDLEVLDALCGGDQLDVFDVPGAVGLDDLPPLVDQRLHRLALERGHVGRCSSIDLLEPLELLLGLRSGAR